MVAILKAFLSFTIEMGDVYNRHSAGGSNVEEMGLMVWILNAALATVQAVILATSSWRGNPSHTLLLSVPAIFLLIMQALICAFSAHVLFVRAATTPWTMHNGRALHIHSLSYTWKAPGKASQLMLIIYMLSLAHSVSKQPCFSPLCAHLRKREDLRHNLRLLKGSWDSIRSCDRLQLI